MAEVRVWAGFDECADVAALHSAAGALWEATLEAEEAGCEVKLVAEDVGDQQVAGTGTVEAVAVAARQYKERGFEPYVATPDREEALALGVLLPDEIGVELEV